MGYWQQAVESKWMVIGSIDVAHTKKENLCIQSSILHSFSWQKSMGRENRIEKHGYSCATVRHRMIFVFRGSK